MVVEYALYAVLKGEEEKEVIRINTHSIKMVKFMIPKKHKERARHQPVLYRILIFTFLIQAIRCPEISIPRPKFTEQSLCKPITPLLGLMKTGENLYFLYRNIFFNIEKFLCLKRDIEKWGVRFELSTAAFGRCFKGSKRTV